MVLIGQIQINSYGNSARRALQIADVHILQSFINHFVWSFMFVSKYEQINALA